MELGETSEMMNATAKYDLKIHNFVTQCWSDPAYQEAFKYRYEYHIFDGNIFNFNFI